MSMVDKKDKPMNTSTNGQTTVFCVQVKHDITAVPVLLRIYKTRKQAEQDVENRQALDAIDGVWGPGYRVTEWIVD